MHMFKNDYSEGACPAVLDAIVATNGEQCEGYTCDAHCRRAAALILDACGLSPEEAGVFFVPGGTAANVVSLSGLLGRPYDAVVCTPDGHINTHETGAIESCGHKALATRDEDGFLSPGEVARVAAENAAFGNHMTRPAAAYVSDTTELGGVYTKAMLTALAEQARSLGMKLYLDGARLGSALASEANDLELPELARLADAFSIGGTKNGLLFGEAVVVRDPQLREDYPWLMKQHQNLLAKGRLLGVQFEAAFEDGARAWRVCAENANARAAELRAGLLAQGWQEWLPSPSNQLFFEMPAAAAGRFAEELGCEIFFDRGETKVVRLVTSWATTREDVGGALAFARQAMARRG